MTQKYVHKFFTLADGEKAGRLLVNFDPRGYQPPVGFSAEAKLIDRHPVTEAYLEGLEWWLFLTPDTIDNIVARVYLSQLTHLEAIEKLNRIDPRLLAEALLDCIERGESRPLFCSSEGVAY